MSIVPCTLPRLSTRLIVELKACKALANEHTAQVLGYLRASGNRGYRIVPDRRGAMRRALAVADERSVVLRTRPWRAYKEGGGMGPLQYLYVAQPLANFHRWMRSPRICGDWPFTDGGPPRQSHPASLRGP